MRVAIKRLDVADIGNLQALVIENIQGLEPGLTVLDSRLLLGHATIDLVAMDANASLVLVALGFSADEEMLLKAVEAYSWCLEYPEAIRRLYPAAHISESRPPRLVFLVGRVPDAFHRKVKQLGFPEIDCVEFRHLEVDGTPVLYFETLVQLRRPLLGAAETRSSAPERVQPMPPMASGHVNGVRGTRVAAPAPAVPVAPVAPVHAVPVPAAAPVAAAAPLVEPEKPLIETVQAVSAPAAPFVKDEAPVVPAAEVSMPGEDAAPAMPGPSTEPLAVLLEQMAMAVPVSPLIEPMPVAEPPAPSVAMPTLEAPEPVLEPQPAPLPSPQPAGVSFADAARELLGAKSIEEAARAAFAAATPSFAERQPTPPQPASPAPAAPVAATPSAETPQPAAEAARPGAPLPQEFAGLNFPNDGVLTRQWMEFLNRMANSK